VLRFFALFMLLFSVLFTVEMLNPVQEHVIVPFTTWLARLSAVLIMPFDANVITYGKVIEHTTRNFAVSIEAGCNGVEAAIVLIAAVVAFPARWGHRLAAILLGFLAIQVMNVARIISLFYLGQWNYDVFLWAHLYLWPVLIMLDVLIVFLLYLRLLPLPAETADA
jgi:exosortase H (IPTLxxWG-CTERM-specific)